MKGNLFPPSELPLKEQFRCLENQQNCVCHVFPTSCLKSSSIRTFGCLESLRGNPHLAGWGLRCTLWKRWVNCIKYEYISHSSMWCALTRLTCSLQQDGAEAKAYPGPAGPDPDAEEPRQRDQGGEVAAEQRRAEAAAAGGAECRVHSWAANPHQRHQGEWRGRRRSLALEQNFILCSFSLSQEAKEQLSPLSAALEKLQQEKQELADRKRQKREEGQEKVEMTWTCHEGIHFKMQENSQNNPNPKYPNNPTYLTT